MQLTHGHKRTFHHTPVHLLPKVAERKERTTKQRWHGVCQSTLHSYKRDWRWVVQTASVLLKEGKPLLLLRTTTWFFFLPFLPSLPHSLGLYRKRYHAHPSPTDKRLHCTPCMNHSLCVSRATRTHTNSHNEIYHCSTGRRKMVCGYLVVSSRIVLSNCDT